MSFIILLLINAVAIYLTAYLLPGVELKNFGGAIVVAIVLGFVNALLRPILLFLTLPINILTLGLFTFVVNALLILLVSAIVPGFSVKNFGWAILFAIVMGIINGIFSAIIF